MKLLRAHLVLPVLAALAVSLVSTRPVQAQDDPAAAPQVAAPPSAREVIDRFVQVTHAAGILAQKRSMHVQGRLSMGATGISGTIESWRAKPDLFRDSMEMTGVGTLVTGYDGKNAWMVHTLLGGRILHGTELLQSKADAAWDAALKTDASYESMRNLGRRKFEGKDCWAVEVVLRPLPDMDPEKTRDVRTSIEYYELESGLLIGRTGRQESELGGGPYTTVLSDYRDFGGQLLAARTVLRQSSIEVELTFDKVEYDTASETEFDPPPEIRVLLQAEAKPKTEPKAEQKTDSESPH